MSNPRDVAALGKLAEEVNELGAALARCIIQGIDGVEPTTGVPNRDWLAKEIADVTANIGIVTVRYSLDIDYDRIRRKINGIQDWIKELG